MPPIYLPTHLPTHAHRRQCLTGIVKGQILALCKSESALREFLEARAFEVDEEKRKVCVCGGRGWQEDMLKFRPCFYFVCHNSR